MKNSVATRDHHTSYYLLSLQFPSGAPVHTYTGYTGTQLFAVYSSLLHNSRRHCGTCYAFKGSSSYVILSSLEAELRRSLSTYDRTLSIVLMPEDANAVIMLKHDCAKNGGPYASVG